jgi:hypothetical protein
VSGRSSETPRCRPGVASGEAPPGQGLRCQHHGFPPPGRGLRRATRLPASKRQLAGRTSEAPDQPRACRQRRDNGAAARSGSLSTIGLPATGAAGAPGSRAPRCRGNRGCQRRSDNLSGVGRRRVAADAGERQYHRGLLGGPPWCLLRRGRSGSTGCGRRGRSAFLLRRWAASRYHWWLRREPLGVAPTLAAGGAVRRCRSDAGRRAPPRGGCDGAAGRCRSDAGSRAPPPGSQRGARRCRSDAGRRATPRGVAPGVPRCRSDAEPGTTTGLIRSSLSHPPASLRL